VTWYSQVFEVGSLVLGAVGSLPIEVVVLVAVLAMYITLIRFQAFKPVEGYPSCSLYLSVHQNSDQFFPSILGSKANELLMEQFVMQSSADSDASVLCAQTPR
jgi:hypothetical protein